MKEFLLKYILVIASNHIPKKVDQPLIVHNLRNTCTWWNGSWCNKKHQFKSGGGGDLLIVGGKVLLSTTDLRLGYHILRVKE